MSTTCQYRGGVSFSPVNLVSRTCQYGPFREHHGGVKTKMDFWDFKNSNEGFLPAPMFCCAFIMCDNEYDKVTKRERLRVIFINFSSSGAGIS